MKEPVTARTGVLELKARNESIPLMIERINGELNQVSCPDSVRRHIDVAIDEIGANIASYAYSDVSDGSIPRDMTLRYEIGEGYAILTFSDSGKPFDPLQAEEPLIGGMPQLGGFGIHIVRNIMDHLEYTYRNGQNCLRVTKTWTGQ